MVLSTRTHVAFTLCLLCIAGINGAAVAAPAKNAALVPAQQRASLETTVRDHTSCKSKMDCPDDGECINAGGRCSDEDCDGVCNVPVICSIDDPCPEGQSCLQTIGEDSPLVYTSCFPDSEVEDISDIAKPVEDIKVEEEQESEDNPCIAVEMLQEFAAHELVFEKHALARVLCDTAGSCATKGHVIIYDGTAMMMGSYCDIVGCEERIMKVNSPRYRRGLKVESPSTDMHFTAFAARYGTAAEEAILAGAFRIGL